jgi:hypothetical protein
MEAADMNKHHEITTIKFEKETMSINIDGQDHVFNLKTVSSRLYNATENERINFAISPSGYGIHWPLIDEDLSIDALLGIVHTSKFNRAA